MSKDRSQQTPAPASSRPEIAEFIERVHALGPASASDKRGRLIFALDATMSRQPTWDSACALQADMFREAAKTGGLDIRSEEHTSELQSHSDLVCRLLLEK